MSAPAARRLSATSSNGAPPRKLSDPPPSPAPKLGALPPLTKEASKYFKQTWAQLDEHEERRANKVSVSLEESVSRRLSALPQRSSRLLQRQESLRVTGVLPKDYSGIRISSAGPITSNDVLALVEGFKAKKPLHIFFATRIISVRQLSPPCAFRSCSVSP
jgi:hypothetical protein